ncbi:hypothetical protein GEV33_014068 [Tenebrio molitor]|uniref:Uncharacterized protein n=1 Tax=Tenebrio molitor TaxID=7067 RepID=A0A8J6H607_TENMO|nr:hypothetical protein GEV33_014068 [Tenebrio molitor]
MPKSPKARKESSNREREEARMSEEGLNPFRKSSRTERSPSRGEERKQSKEIEKKIETVLREIKEDMVGIGISSRERAGGRARKREHTEIVRRNGYGNENNHDKIRKELAAVREEMRGREEKGQLEKADWMERMKMIEEKMEQRENKEKKNNVIITGTEAISGNLERGVEEWLQREIGVKVNVKEAFKINKDKMMLAKIESWEQKKNIMLNDDLTKEKRQTQKKLRELAREERDRGKRVKIGYRKIQINGEWFRWDERQEKLEKIC